MSPPLTLLEGLIIKVGKMKKSLFSVFVLLAIVLFGILISCSPEKEPKIYTITFNGNGADNTDEIITLEVKEQEEYSFPSEGTYTKRGYKIRGWSFSTDATGYSSRPEWQQEAYEDRTWYAIWEPVDYYITYYSDNEDITHDSWIAGNPRSYTIESESFTLKPLSAEKGFKFIGWKYADEDDSTAEEELTIEKGTIGDLSFVAVWEELSTYKITYDANGGNGTFTESKFQGETIKIADKKNVSRTGYYFDGWYTSQDGSGTNYLINSDYSEDCSLTLYAKWTPQIYSITYDPKGGELSEEKAVPTEYTIETETFALPVPTMRGYNFLGWKIEYSSDYTAKKEIEKGSYGSMNFVAVWEGIPSCTIYYKANGGTGSFSVTEYKGTPITISKGLERNGYKFNGWNTSQNGGGTSYKEGDSYPNNSSLTLYAQWQIITYNINYEGVDNATFSIDNPKTYTIESKTFHLNPPVKDGFVFLGWQETNSKDTTTRKDIEITKGTTGDKSFTAQFRKSYTYNITFNINGADGGEGPKEQILTEGDSLKMPSCGTLYKDNYTFCGWSENQDGSGTIYKEDQTTKLDKNTTFFAVWKANSLYFTLLPSGTAYSVKCNDPNITNAVIPNTYRDIPVTTIEENAFKGCKNLTKITIPASIINVGNSALSDCVNLTTITVENDNTTYKSAGNCLIEVSSQTLIAGCKNSIIPPDISIIGDYAFAGCSKIKTIDIPDNTTTIGISAFSGCTGLEQVEIPAKVSSIGENAFSDCSDLEIIFKTGREQIPDKALYGSSGVVSVKIPSTVTSIGANAFSGCSLKSITIPSTTTSISNTALKDCGELESIEVNKYNSKYRSVGNCLIERNSEKLIKGCNNSVIPEGVLVIGYAAFMDCSFKEITIPASVTTIEKSAFLNCSKLEKITMPNKVTTIGDSAFYGCSNLNEIVLSESVTTIENSAFAYCPSLSYIKINAAVTNMEWNIFLGCNNLKVEFEYGMKEIPKYALYMSSGIASVVIPETVTSIGDFAFYECSGLKEIIIPASVTKIGKDAFSRCSGLKVIFAEGTTRIIDSALKNAEGIISVEIPNTVNCISKEAFSGCSSLESIKIPENVVGIYYAAFADCSKLDNVEIPQNVKALGSSVFSGCSKLTKITINTAHLTEFNDSLFSGCVSLETIGIPSTIKVINSNVFKDCSSLTTISLPTTLQSIGKGAFQGCSKLTEISIPASVTTIGDSAFEKTGLTSVTIPSSVTSLGNGTFNYCKDITSVSIQSSVADICSAGSSLFFGCYNITTVELGTVHFTMSTMFYNSYDKITTVNILSGAESICAYAFLNCSSLISITFSDTVKTIEKYAFSKCSNLKYVKLPENIVTIGDYAFSGCSSMSIINETLPSTLTTIGECAFKDCEEISKFPMQAGVTSIGNQAFANCKKLENMTIPTTVKTMGSCILQNCTSLKTVTFDNALSTIPKKIFDGDSNITSVIIPKSVTSIGEGAFNGCTLLSITFKDREEPIPSLKGCSDISSVIISGTVNRINYSTFENCTNLSSVSLPDTITYIGSSAFKGCTGLSEISIPVNVSEIGKNAFEGCTGLSNITIPANTKTIGQDAFKDCQNLNITYDKRITIYVNELKSTPGIISINIKEGTTTIENLAFYDCSGLKYVIIPSSITSIGFMVFSGCTDLKNVYYRGTQEQWQKMNPSSFGLSSKCTIHYNWVGDVPQE